MEYAAGTHWRTGQNPAYSHREPCPGAPSPPFRADHVGSLLRPPDAARRARDAAPPARSTPTALRAVEDEAIRDGRRDAGGRRPRSSRPTASCAASSWHMDFIYQLGGVEQARVGGSTVEFHNPTATRSSSRRARCASTARCALDAHDLRRGLHVRCASGDDAAMPKLTIPSPSMMHYRGGRAAIDETSTPTSRSSGPTSPRPTARRSPRSASSAARYLQFDDTSLAYLNDPAQRAHIAARSATTRSTSTLTYIRAPQRGDRQPARGHGDHDAHVPRQLPLVVVASGGYDYVAEALFNELDGRRLLHRVRRRALGRLRAAALRAAGQDGRARPRDDQAGELEARTS